MSFRQGEFPPHSFPSVDSYFPTDADEYSAPSLGCSHTPVLTHAERCVSGRTALRSSKGRNASHLRPLTASAANINDPKTHLR
jgi:hypothetical protein